jgi:sugar lactone lactonase YvrE
VAVRAASSGTLVAPPRSHTFGLRRVTAREIALFLPGAAIDSPAGLAVTRLLATDGSDADDDDEVTIVATDRAGFVFTNFGLLGAGTFDGRDTPLGPLREPSDVAIDRRGRVVVSDSGNRRLVLLQHDGKRLVPVGAATGFLEPRGVAALGEGAFLVCDRRFNTVFRFDFDTGQRQTFGLEVTFDRPVAVACTEAGERLASGTPAHLVIVDRDGARLRSFTPDGALRATQDAASLGVADAAFDAVDLDYYGNVFAVDRRGNRMHKLRADLYPLDTFGRRGTGEGEFLSPRGLAIHRRLGQVFVTEEDGGQYLWIGTDVRDFEVAPRAGAVELSYLLTEASLVDVRVLDDHGRTVAVLLEGEKQGAGPQRGAWDGTRADGTRVAPGAYSVRIRARATYASRSTWERELMRGFTWSDTR